MQIDATTFALEIINFLILLWILRRFFFAPVRAAIAWRTSACTSTFCLLASAGSSGL